MLVGFLQVDLSASHPTDAVCIAVVVLTARNLMILRQRCKVDGGITATLGIGDICGPPHPLAKQLQAAVVPIGEFSRLANVGEVSPSLHEDLDISILKPHFSSGVPGLVPVCIRQLHGAMSTQFNRSWTTCTLSSLCHWRLWRLGWRLCRRCLAGLVVCAAVPKGFALGVALADAICLVVSRAAKRLAAARTSPEVVAAVAVTLAFVVALTALVGPVVFRTTKGLAAAPCFLLWRRVVSVSHSNSDAREH
mmetsp:Transcript_20458/g.48537  ORF Transcript_20458/g.48537 Transcript_20458/m.48537 type:complete len:250 (+) Transcript_20458:653-1402(+)